MQETFSYIAVQWLHSESEYPIELYSELDRDRNEVRKVDIFADGRRLFADADSNSGDTMLGLVAVPSLEEIAEDSQFVPREITREEFEAIWRSAHS